jgi:hypothetical protein
MRLCFFGQPVPTIDDRLETGIHARFGCRFAWHCDTLKNPRSLARVRFPPHPLMYVRRSSLTSRRRYLTYTLSGWKA